MMLNNYKESNLLERANQPREQKSPASRELKGSFPTNTAYTNYITNERMQKIIN